MLNHDGTILIDGRNRYRACEILAIEPLHKKLGPHYTDARMVDFIFSANLRRRQLDLGQRAMLGLKLEAYHAAHASKGGRPPQDAEEPGLDPGQVLPEHRRKSAAKAGAAVSASRDAVTKAKAIVRDAPDLAEKVGTGQMALASRST